MSQIGQAQLSEHYLDMRLDSVDLLLVTIELQEVDAEVLRPGNQRPGNSEEEMIIGIRATLDDFYTEIQKFPYSDDPGLIFSRLAAYSGYASEMRGQICRHNGTRLNQLRIKEIDPFLKEVDRQFKIWSRQVALAQHEWDIAKGGV